MAARCCKPRRRAAAGKFSGNAAQTLAELDDSRKQVCRGAPALAKGAGAATDPAAKATAAARGGWSALEAKQSDDAEKLFQTARQLDAGGDSRKVANTGLLRILFQQKRYAEWVALYAAEKDKLLDSARSEILYDLGHAQFSLKHWTEAVAGFDQYLGAFSTQDAAVTAAYERFLAVTQIDRDKTVGEAEAYLKAWPKSPYRARVRLLQAQELSREKKFADALPLWENLAKETGDAVVAAPGHSARTRPRLRRAGQFPQGRDGLPGLSRRSYRASRRRQGRAGENRPARPGAARRLPAKSRSTARRDRCVEGGAVPRAGGLARAGDRARIARPDLRAGRPGAGSGDGRDVPRAAR